MINGDHREKPAYLTGFAQFSDLRKAMITNLRTDSHRLLFACSCCERLFERYSSFCKVANEGDVELMASTLDGLWGFVQSKKRFENVEIDLYKQTIQALTPNGEDFPETFSKEAYGAEYFCSALQRSFDFVVDRLTSRICNIADDAFNAVEQSVRRELKSHTDPTKWNAEVDASFFIHAYRLDQTMRHEAWQHKSVQREVRKQMSALTFLEGVTEVTGEIILTFRATASVV